MIKNYIKIAWRNLWKNKTFTLINIIGLSVAFGVAILLSIAGFFELSYDKFHSKADSIYKVYWTAKTPKGPVAFDTHAAPLMDAIKTDVPDVKKTTRHLQEEAIVSFGEKEINMDAIWVDADFFDIFTFPSIQGKMKNPLGEQSEIVITESTAERLFGKDEAVGKTVQILINGEDQPFTISAVVENPAAQSSLEFDLAVRFEKEGSFLANKNSWGSRYHDIYVQLAANANPVQFDEATHSLVDLNFQQRIENAKRDGAQPYPDGRYFRFGLLPLTDVNFVKYDGYPKVSRNTPYLVLGIALLILFIACVNFVNMSVAKSGQRLREIGMRKTLGAKQKQLFFQFWSESFFVFFFSACVGFILSMLSIDGFKTLFSTEATFGLLLSPTPILLFLLAIVLITLLVGGYPALLLSKLGTIQSLKGKLDTSGKNRMRDALIVIQFSIAILLITGTLVLRSQLDFLRNKDLGFNKEQVLSFPIDGKKDSYTAIELLRAELSGNPDILEISAADNNLGYGRDRSISRSMFGFEYKNRNINTNVLTVDYNFVETLDLEMVSGRNFQRGFANDSLSVVINEAMAKEFGEQDPLTAYVSVTDSLNFPVIGVLKDYNFEKLDRAIAPMTMFIDRRTPLYYGYVKVASSNMAKSYDAVEKAWSKIEPNALFLGSFLDENIDRTFRKEKRMTTMITYGSILAIALSCIGLFAISLLIVNQRTKEIGVRKVIGASVSNIIFLLTKDFLALVGISFLIASPIAWWFMESWLQNYPFKIDLNIGFSVTAGLIAVGIALFTVGGRTVKAALQNPVKSLRTE
ncbi:ABC transporter permease [Flagellimonas flava]|uniref:ABC-type transport system, involved in lipoprotein release, permease component n=1 Tax=Flagellimonas flava TaxID=570519 RepID=A0A1M5KWP8_9FLAO|nr:ABC transporter permease [Allomuricauda flava]SHG56939.1 ABC-type transport system, involved in lipoprotein release, permease component [Allomuricauda flava]